MPLSRYHKIELSTTGSRRRLKTGYADASCSRSMRDKWKITISTIFDLIIHSPGFRKPRTPRTMDLRCATLAAHHKLTFSISPKPATTMLA